LNADDLWKEEEAKLKLKTYHNETAGKNTKSLSTLEAADNLWDEEEQKLQSSTEDIFDDPQAREAFLGHRRGRLQDTGVDNKPRSPSQSRRRQLVKALQEDEELENSKRSTRTSRSRSRSRSVDPRKAPTPEMQAANMRKSRSKSRDTRFTDYAASEGRREENRNESSHSRVNKNKDLVVIRSVEDAQRLRSSKMQSTPTTGGYAMSRNNYDSFNDHEYSNVGRTDESNDQQKQSLRQAKSHEPVIVDLTRDDRDDVESPPDSASSKRGSSKSAANGEGWPDYDTVASATKELRKLEKKIEKQLRKSKSENNDNEEWDARAVSAKEIRKLEKKLAQKLQRDNEKRASKLKRIKRKVPKTPSSGPPEKEHDPAEHQSQANQSRFMSETAPEEINSSNVPAKKLPLKLDDSRSKYEQLRVIRSSRFLRGSSSRREGRTVGGSPEDAD